MKKVHHENQFNSDRNRFQEFQNQRNVSVCLGPSHSGQELNGFLFFADFLSNQFRHTLSETDPHINYYQLPLLLLNYHLMTIAYIIYYDQ